MIINVMIMTIGSILGIGREVKYYYSVMFLEKMSSRQKKDVDTS